VSWIDVETGGGTVLRLCSGAETLGREAGRSYDEGEAVKMLRGWESECQGREKAPSNLRRKTRIKTWNESYWVMEVESDAVSVLKRRRSFGRPSAAPNHHIRNLSTSFDLTRRHSFRKYDEYQELVMCVVARFGARWAFRGGVRCIVLG